MTLFGYHASHELHSPRELLEHVRLAATAGFACGMCSDHFHPWVEEQGHSGFAWSWLGAALEATTLTFGCVNAPGWRYHPAVIAQAAATLAEMYPGRFWLAAGSGEALNEGITGEPWPSKGERDGRLAECVSVMRALWAGATVTHRGRVVVEEAKLYTLPETPPLLFGSALTPATARWVGGWADGLLTIGASRDELRALLDAFCEGGGAGKPVKVQVALGWAATDADALALAHRHWAANLVGPDVLPNLRTPVQFAAIAERIAPETIADALPVTADLSVHAERLRLYVEEGIDEVYVFNVCGSGREFIETFGERVLPELRKR